MLGDFRFASEWGEDKMVFDGFAGGVLVKMVMEVVEEEKKISMMMKRRINTLYITVLRLKTWRIALENSIN